MGSTATRTSYDRHRQRAAARRRRVVLLLVLATALCVAGVAIAYPKLRGTETDVQAPIMPAAATQAPVEEVEQDRKSTRLNSSHVSESRMPSSA